MNFLVSGVILIKAINTMGYPIAKLKDYLQLIIMINNESTIIPCKEERSGGIYAFNINSISPFAKVFVCLKQSVLLDTSMISDDKLNLCNATQYLSQMPYFLHPDCKQINFIGTMCNTSKPIPFTFILSPKAINIGIIKAYKKDNITKSFLADSTALSNPKNEIYTMDLSQEINLKAFVYERQKTYVVKKKYNKGEEGQKVIDTLKQGNITKNITSITPLESANIKWAFKIVNGSYKADSNARDEAFTELGKKQVFTIDKKLDSIPNDKYIELAHLQGDSITIKLSDIFSDTALESLIDKNIIFFAYNNNPAYCLYTDNKKISDKKIVSQDKITSIELKILKTRFRLEFDGEYLFFYENEREIAKWQARSGKAIDKISADSSEFKAMKRCFIPFTSDKSFYYDLSLHSSDSTKHLSENEYFIKLPIIDDIEIYSDSTLLTKIAQINSEPFKLDNNDVSNTNINTTLNGITFLKRYFSQKLKADNTPQAIPLKVKYQKRILIIIERFKQTTESTTARMNIYVDRKRVDSNGKIADNAEFNSIYDIATPYAFILERPSPDSIGGELKLRIPEGRYSGAWHKGKKNMDSDKFNENTLNLKNDFVGKNRAILIHFGSKLSTSVKGSNGCLLISKALAKSKQTKTIIDDVLAPDSTAKRALSKAIQKNNNTIGFIDSYLFGDDIATNHSTPEQVIEHIEVRIKNGF